MTARVLITTPDIDDHVAIRSGEIVSSSNWIEYSQLANWLLGKGGTLLNAMCEINYPYIAPAASLVWRYKIWPRGFAVTRLWIIRLMGSLWTDGTMTSMEGYGTITINDGGTDEVSANWVTDGVRGCTVYLLQDITALSNTVEEVTVTITGDINCADDKIYVEQISCYELPRYELERPTAMLSTDTDTCKSNCPIYHADAEHTDIEDANNSVYPVGVMINGSWSVARRNGLFHWFRPSAPVVTNSTNYISVYAANPEVLGRYIFDADVKREIEWYAYGYVHGIGGEVGYIKATAANGETSIITMPTTAGCTWSAKGILSISAEDMTSEDGRRETNEEVKFEIKVNNASDTLCLQGISMGEGVPA